MRKCTSIWLTDGSVDWGSTVRCLTIQPSRKNRHGRFRQSDLLRRVFETVLQRCIREGLVGGEAFAVDASLIRADANRQKGIEGAKGLPAEATGRAVKEYLAVADNAAFGAATEVPPKFISPADPAARWTGAHGGQAFFGYSTNYLIDLDNAIIVDVEATTAIRRAEVLAAKHMIERSMQRFGIEPHVTVFDKSTRQDGTFSRDDFTYDHAGDVYYCPGGKMLTTTSSPVNDGATLRYRASKYDCQACRVQAELVGWPSFRRLGPGADAATRGHSSLRKGLFLSAKGFVPNFQNQTHNQKSTKGDPTPSRFQTAIC